MTRCEYGAWSGKTPDCQEIYCSFPGRVKVEVVVGQVKVGQGLVRSLLVIKGSGKNPDCPVKV